MDAIPIEVWSALAANSGGHRLKDEENYISTKNAFFEWIERSDNPYIIEFNRKHVEIKEARSPSLKPCSFAESHLLTRRDSLFLSISQNACPNAVADFSIRRRR
jgi:hypothetical protein